MGCQQWLPVLLFLLLPYLLPSSSAQTPPFSCNHNSINYTSNTIFDANLNSALSNLSQNIDDNGFYNASAGRSPDRANAIALCRGDVQLDRCRSCVQEATTELVRQCPNQKQGVIFYEFCLLRFSNVSIFGTFVSSPMFFLYNVQNATSPDRFVKDRGILIRNLGGVAAGGGPRRKVAFGVTNTSDSQEIYAIVQCSPDLFPDDCNSCLNELDRTQMAYCGTSIGCRALGPSCNFRYETLPFYNETRLQEFLETAPNETRVLDSLRYDFDEIRAATNDFSAANKLGKDEFGTVYKGKLGDGREIGVKKLERQDEGEFKKEVLMMMKIGGINVVRLLGFSIEGREKLVVYESIKY